MQINTGYGLHLQRTYARQGYPKTSDAILDRIVHDAYKINIENLDSSKDISLSEIYGLSKSVSE